MNDNTCFFRIPLAIWLSTCLICLAVIDTLGQGNSPSGSAPPPDIEQMIPPSPEASALAKFTHIPVNTYTGTPDISIPLYALTYKDISVPIDLKYHASGIRVSEEASRVGLGWTVHAGGVISRVVRGNRDEKAGDSGYMNLDAEGWTVSCGAYNFVENVVTTGGIDAEPDAFSFSFMGMSGKFVFGTDGEIRVLDCTSLVELTPTITAQDITAWTVRDGKGFTYEFSVSDRSKNHSVTDGQTGTHTEWANTAWYLTKIISPLQDEIVLQYNQVSPLATNRDVSRSESDQHLCQSIEGDCGAGDHYNTTSSNIVDRWMMLSQISSPNFVVEFNDGLAREDLEGTLALGEILIKETDQVDKVRSIHFFQSHFIANGCTGLESDDECYRLRLDSIAMIGFSPTHQSGTVGEVYSFDYNSENLPRRDSYEQDHWGFYNFNGQGPNGTLLPAMTIYDCLGNPEFLSGADRSPHPTKMLACMLEKIHYPTGGRTEFTFEPHTYSRSGGQVFTPQIAGGARIQQIRMVSGNGNPDMITEYEYIDKNDIAHSSGMINAPIQYTYNKITFLEYLLRDPITGAPIVYVNECEYTIRSSSSQIPIMTTQGSHVGYDRVIEKQVGNGRAEYEYYSVQDFPDLILQIDPDRYDKFYLKWNNDWKRGILEEKTVFNEAGIPLQTTEYEYSFPICETIVGLRAEMKREKAVTGPGIQDEFFCYTMEDRVGWAQLNQVTETIYAQGSATVSTTKLSTYEYNARQQLRSVEQVNSDGTLSQTETYYPGESDPDNVSLTLGIPEMYDESNPNYLHILAPVVKRRNLLDAQALNKSEGIYTYHSGLGQIQLIENHVYPSYALASPQKQYFFYDIKGHLHGSEREQGTRTSILRTYNSSLVSAKVSNGSIDNCAFSGFDFEVDPDPANSNKRIDGNWEFLGSSGWDRSGARTGIGEYALIGSREIVTTVSDAGKYTLSFWTTVNNELDNDFQLSHAYTVISDGTSTINGWKYYEVEMTVFMDQEISIKGKPSSTISSKLIDELRLYPSDAQMNTVSYDAYLRVHTKTDANNRSTYYSYDELGRLIEVRDHNSHLMGTTEYKYHNE